MKTVKLSTVLRHRADKIKIDDATSYKLVRIRLHRKGVMLRHEKSGAEIRTKTQQLCKEGDFIVAEMDAKVGGYGFIPKSLDGAIVSSHYYLYEIDEEQLLPSFLNVVCQAGILQEQIIAKGSTNYASVRAHTVLDWTIPLPPLEDQNRIARQFDAAEVANKQLELEITHQQSLLGKLKQAILQEAIQGKLTADWRAANPDVEPASELLQRIQAEKARLITEKKIRKEKPLPKITPEEIPFEIPDGWDWCRFGSVVGEYKAGKSFKCEARSVTDFEWGVLKTSAVTSTQFLEKENKFYTSEHHDDWSTQVQVGNLIFCRASGSKGLAGTAAIVDSCESNLLLSDKTIRITLLGEVSQKFIWFHNNSGATTEYYRYLNSGKSTSMNNITKGQLLSKPIPLPPLAEQAAIVERVEALMATCRELETEIEHSRTHAADLLQAVLKEAFAPDSA